MDSVRLATRKDVQVISFHLRCEDTLEILASTGMHPSQVLPDCFIPGTTWVVDTTSHGPIALFGVTRINADAGAPWMVATPLLIYHQLYFLRNCKRWVDTLGEGYSLLINCTDARNTVHHKWLQWCGFTFTKLHPQWGFAKIPFWQFEKQIKCVTQ